MPGAGIEPARLSRPRILSWTRRILRGYRLVQLGPFWPDSSDYGCAPKPARTRLRCDVPASTRDYERAAVRLLDVALVDTARRPFARRAARHPCSDVALSFDASPFKTASTEMSSSRSGQWMPIPGPINSQCRRSRGVPSARRGYDVSGTETARPSRSSTMRLSAVTRTFFAADNLIPSSNGSRRSLPPNDGSSTR